MTETLQTRVRQALLQDLDRNCSDVESSSGHNSAGPKLRRVLRTAPTVRYLAVFLFRLSQVLGERSGLAGSLVKQLNHILTGADLAWQASIGSGLVLYHPTGVVLGPHVSIGRSASLQQGVTIGGSGGAAGGAESSPTIGDNLVCGPGARVFGRIRLGNGVVVGANAVVVSDVPDGTTVVGIPARPLPPPSEGSQ